jgi:shikimate dehydrogenase
MAPNYKADLVGVFGSPVAENPTGAMQEAGFAALGLNWRYLTIEVRHEELAAAMQGLRAMNFAGINLTIPHKVAVLEYLDEISPDARLMGAVNTVRRAGDRLIGENTDGKGFLRALRDDAQVEPKGKRVVVLGAGGAARAVCVELALAGAQAIEVVNRNPQRGHELVWLLNEQTPVNATYVPWMAGMRVAATTDLLVNCTSIGLYPDVDGIPDIDTHAIAPHMVVCDVIPNPPNTPFLRAAAARGAKTIDGLGMLVYQGAIAFKMWTGHDAPVGAMKSALAAEFCL